MKLVEPSTLSGNLTDKSVLVTFSFLPDKLRDKDLKRINITVNGSAANGNAIDAGTVDLPVVRTPSPKRYRYPYSEMLTVERAQSQKRLTPAHVHARAHSPPEARARARNARARASPTRRHAWFLARSALSSCDSRASRCSKTWS